MANDLMKQAKPAVENLLDATEGQLYEQLGIRAKAIINDPSKSGSFEPEVVFDGSIMGLKEDLLDFGKQFYKRWQLEAHKLTCGSATSDAADRNDLANAFGLGEASAGAAIAALLVSQFGLAPAIATVIGVLLIKRFFRPTYEEFCKAWTKSITKAPSS